MSETSQPQVRRPIPIARHPWEAGRMTPETAASHEARIAYLTRRRESGLARQREMHKQNSAAGQSTKS